MFRVQKLPKMIVVVGPTASGKTDLAVRLARKFSGEIISADSRQVYKGMDIGTAKLKRKAKNAKRKVKENIHLIDVVEPNQNFTVARFKKMAIKIARDIRRRGKVPILAGGTGLYIQAVVDNLEIPAVAPDKKLRRSLEKKSTAALARLLAKTDPDSARRFAANRRYLIRAIEIVKKTGKKLSEVQKKGSPLFDVLPLGMALPREKLYKRIDARVEEMMKRGLLKEVQALAKKYSWRTPAMSGIGYKEIGMFLRGEKSLDEAVALLKTNTHHYAKRQMTWFKRDKGIHWVKQAKEAERLVRKFLK